MHREMALTFPILRSKGVAVVVDMDDNFDAIDRDNIAWFASEPCWHTEAEARRIATLHGGRVLAAKHTNHGWYLLPDHPGRTHRGWIRDALAHVDLLTVSTPALAEHYSPFVKSGRVKVIRNHLPARYCDIVRAPNPRPVVGWTGTIQTHPKDLDVVGDGVARAKAESDFELRIVGTGVGCRARWGVDPDVATGWRPIEEYPTEYAQMDVALCPLNESEFNRAKSNLKALEAAALGVVPIMSPSEEYVRFHKRHGIGLIARTPGDWRRHIVRLVTDHELRARMAAHGRQVARSLTIEGNAHLWVDAWRSAVQTNARFRRVAA
jgi:glycosyltransferase involved in cell wall biosynthesis